MRMRDYKSSRKLNIAGLIFDRENMFRLTSDQFVELTSKHEIVIDYDPGKNYGIHENFGRLFLSFDGSLSSYFFEFEPEKEIDLFVRNSYLTYFFPKTGKVKLLDELSEPLVDILSAKSFDTSAIAAIDKTRVLEQLDEKQIFVDKIDDNAVVNL